MEATDWGSGECAGELCNQRVTSDLSTASLSILCRCEDIAGDGGLFSLSSLCYMSTNIVWKEVGLRANRRCFQRVILRGGKSSAADGSAGCARVIRQGGEAVWKIKWRWWNSPTRACYSFSRLLWHIFPFTVYFFKAAHTQPLTEAEMTKTLYDVCRMTPPSQNLSHTHQNQTFPSKPTICAQLKMYVFSFI